MNNKKKRIFDIIQIGYAGDVASRTFDIARIKYIFSGSGIVDLLSFLPNYLPVFFPAGAVAFRMFRVIRILRIFRVNSYYDALNVITEVIRRKGTRYYPLYSSL